MNRALIGLTLLSGLVMAADPPPEVAGPAVFYWRNNETLAGELLSADAETLTFKTPLVQAPAVIERSRLQMVEYSAPEKSKPCAASWSLLLKNGDCAHGDSAKLTAGNIELESSRHGLVKVPLDQVRSLRRLRGGTLVFGGPCGSAGLWGAGFAADGGALATRKWNDTVQVPMELPDKVAVDIVIRSTQMLNFRLELHAKSGVTPTIETWGKDVVLAAPVGSQMYGLFTPLLKLTGEEKSLSFRMYWDQVGQRMTVYDFAGKELGKLAWEMVEKKKPDAPKPNSPRVMARNESDEPKVVAGLAVKNRGANWVIDDLCARQWDGAFPKPMPAGLPRVESTSGQWRQLDKTKALDLDSVLSVVWSADVPALPTTAMRPAVIFADGTTLSGQIQSLANGQLTMKTPWSAEPVKCSTDGLWRMIFEPAEHPVEEPLIPSLDRLHWGTANIHGTLVSDGGAEPRWRFIGGKEALAIAMPPKRQDLEVNWAHRPEAETGAQLSSLIIADEGEVLRAGLQGIDETGVTFESPWTTRTALEHEHMRGLKLGNQAKINKGFGDPNWTVIKGDAKKVQVTAGDKPENDVLHIEPGITYGHPAMVHGDEIRFTLAMDPQNYYGGVQLDLFTADREDQGDGALSIVIARSSSQLYVVKNDGGNRGVRSDQMLNNLPSGPVKIRLTFKDSKVQLFANETQLLNEPVKPAQRSRSGLRLSCGSLWGNPLRPIDLKNFIVAEATNAVPGLSVSDTVKQEAMMVPRFRREQLPSHALVAGNGDVIRGQIDAATQKLVRFSTGLESHDVPTERLQAILWLAKPKPEVKKEDSSPALATPPAAKPEPPANTHWITLDDQTSLVLQVDSFTSDKVVGHSDLWGTVDIPPSRISAMRWAARPPNAALKSYLDWQLVRAPEPILPEAGETASALVGKAAPDFTLAMLTEGKFQLSKQKDKVVVLDFWATWCGPCVASMPGLLDVMKTFKDKPVAFMTLNQGEPPAQVKQFIERRSWELPVAFDDLGKVAKDYGVEGIPQTVVIGKDGKVAWVHTGYSAEGVEKLTEAVQKALEAK